MDCTDLTAVLSGFVDDELDTSVRHDAERHLAECGRCRTLVGRAESLDLAMRSAATDWGRESPLPRDLVDAVLLRTVGNRAAILRAQRFGAAGWLAAAAALGLAATLWFLRDSVTPRVLPNAGDGAIAALDPKLDQPRNVAPAPEERVKEDSEQMLVSLEEEVVGPPIWKSRDWDDAVALLPNLDQDGTAISPSFDESPENDAAVAMNPDGDEDYSAFDASTRAEHADALFAASLLLSQLGDIQDSDLGNADRIRGIVAYDGLVDRLSAARSAIPAEDRAALESAESILMQLNRGSTTQDDLRQMKEEVRRLQLPHTLNQASLKLEPRPPA